MQTILVLMLATAGTMGTTGGNTLAYIATGQVSIPAVRTTVEVRPETHKSGRVTYHYRVLNRRMTPLAEIQIGISPDLDEPELSEEPIGWDLDENNCPQSMTAPRGWIACVGLQEESSHHFLIFAASSDSVHLRPNADLSFSVTVAHPDSAYNTAHFWALSTALPNDMGRVKQVDRRR